jgi:hypothetical protein
MALGKLGRRGGVGSLGSVGKPGGTINLSGSTFPANSSLNTVIGTLSVVGGTGVYTYSLTSNPGTLFNISGSSLRVTSTTIAAGSYPVTIQANNGAGSIINGSFVLTATGTAALKFNAASNSQYMPLLEDI